MTAANMRALRQRQKAAGLVRVEFYVTPQESVKIKQYVARLARLRNQQGE